MQPINLHSTPPFCPCRFKVYIDSNGDAEGNYTLIAMHDDYHYPGGKKMTMQPVGHFIYNATNTDVPVGSLDLIYSIFSHILLVILFLLLLLLLLFSFTISLFIYPAISRSSATSTRTAQ